jgi:hypothetical protein
MLAPHDYEDLLYAEQNYVLDGRDQPGLDEKAGPDPFTVAHRCLSANHGVVGARNLRRDRPAFEDPLAIVRVTVAVVVRVAIASGLSVVFVVLVD